MSLIIGIEYEKGTVMVADGQINEQIGVKGPWIKRQTFNQKLRVLLSMHPLQVVMGACGPTAVAQKLLDMCDVQLSKIGRSISFGAIVEICEHSMSELQGKWAHIRGADTLHLLVAAYHERWHKKSLYVVYPQAISSCMEGFACIGDGRPYAEYILSTLYSQSLTLDEAAAIGIFCVAQVETIDPSVGGVPSVCAAGLGTFPTSKELTTRIQQLAQIRYFNPLTSLSRRSKRRFFTRASQS